MRFDRDRRPRSAHTWATTLPCPRCGRSLMSARALEPDLMVAAHQRATACSAR